ncbi:MAG: hypothetical protein GWN73_20665, partial [Actinobacteria bacterium]|nr:hypothetical protein [Actinomycetota bacterium]NIU67707.1 hypothetical protein [Actinomycetota bacterium]
VFFRADPSSLERFQVRNLVRNEGDGASGAFTVRVLADGLDVGSESFGPLDRDAEEIAIVEVGPLAPGQRQLTVQI